MSQTNDQMTGADAIVADLTEKLRVAREALMDARITMSITPARDTMPGYLAELQKSSIVPTLKKVDAALSTIDAPVSQPTP